MTEGSNDNDEPGAQAPGFRRKLEETLPHAKGECIGCDGERLAFQIYEILEAWEMETGRQGGALFEEALSNMFRTMTEAGQTMMITQFISRLSSEHMERLIQQSLAQDEAEGATKH